MDIFRTLSLRLLSVTAMLYFSGKANTSIHGLTLADTADRDPQFNVKWVRKLLIFVQFATKDETFTNLDVINAHLIPNISDLVG